MGDFKFHELIKHGGNISFLAKSSCVYLKKKRATCIPRRCVKVIRIFSFKVKFFHLLYMPWCRRVSSLRLSSNCLRKWRPQRILSTRLFRTYWISVFPLKCNSVYLNFCFHETTIQKHLLGKERKE